MGKIVKYCNSCDEGFAEKFTFCPDCGASLESFEMNPVTAPAATPPAAEPSPAASEMHAVEPTAPAIDPAPTTRIHAVEEVAPVIAAAPIVEKAVEHSFETKPAVEAAPEPVVEAAPEADVEPAVEPESVPASMAPPPPTQPVFASQTPVHADEKKINFEAEHTKYSRSGGYYVTVMEEKNVKQRNSLLMGTFCFVMVALIGGLVYNIFSKDLDIAAINDDVFNAVIMDDVPMNVDDKQPKVEKDKGGGGGGGGREEQKPVSQGDLADQTKDPIRPPDAHVDRLSDPSLVMPPPSTQGNKTFPKIYGKWGDPNALAGDDSNGPGSGGGMGNGRGTGQGNGVGTGAGNGNGSGYGNGNGNGNGNGSGPGGDDGPPPRAVGVSSPIKILSKPKPSYTDTARQNQVSGTVILRVTFLASGQIGSISAVKGLGDGLTEQAIAAARSIRFDPAKINGNAQTVTKQVEYNFSIY